MATVETPSPPKNESVESTGNGTKKEPPTEEEELDHIKDDENGKENGVGDGGNDQDLRNNITDGADHEVNRQEQTTASAPSDSDQHCE